MAEFLKKWLPEELAFKINRWRRVMMTFLFYRWCTNFPGRASHSIKCVMQRQIGTSMTKSVLEKLVTNH